jgi:hypothetical protein
MNMEDFLLCNGDETQEIVKPTGEHDFCIQRFIGMSCTRKPEIFIWAIPHNDSAILPTPYPIQKGLREFSQSPFLIVTRLNYFFVVYMKYFIPKRFA